MLPRLALSVNDIPGLLDYVQIYSEGQSSTPAAVVSSDPVKPRTRSVSAKNAVRWVPGNGHDDP